MTNLTLLICLADVLPSFGTWLWVISFMAIIIGGFCIVTFLVYDEGRYSWESEETKEGQRKKCAAVYKLGQILVICGLIGSLSSTFVPSEEAMQLVLDNYIEDKE